jgi:hypothetical protein
MRGIEFHARVEASPRIRRGLDVFITFAISQEKQNKVHQYLQSFSIMI